MSIDTLVCSRWFDRHLHLRDGDMLEKILPCTLNQRATGAVIMGNLKVTPTTNMRNTIAYRDRITNLLPEGSDFKPRMTLYLTDEITSQEVVQGFDEGIWCAVKLYMADQNGKGGTTGSQHGVRNLLSRYNVFEAMEERGIPLLGHFEAVERPIDEFDREVVSIDRDAKPIRRKFPKLPMVIEHITDSRAADFVVGSERATYATVTVHHLMINRNEMFWGGMNPGHYCRPVPKREEHRRKIREYVTSGHLRFGAGTDSAPHDEEAKSRCYGCAAGMFTALTAVEMYTTVFDEDGALKHLDAFLGKNFVEIYGMEPSSENMTLQRTPCEVPRMLGEIPVFKGGSTLPWKLVD